MSTAFFFVEPVDVLMLRGNRSFGDAGEHGEAVMPPWPSVFAGAFRSALLASDAVRLQRYASIAAPRGEDDVAEERRQRTRDAIGPALFDVLGTPDAPGSFRLSWLTLGRGGQPIVPLPADLVAGDSGASLAVLAPAPLPRLIGAALPMQAVLRQRTASKPASGICLDAAGLNAHLVGKLPASALSMSELFDRESRLGIAIGAASGTAERGALYTTEALRFREGAGFIVGIDGLGDVLPSEGTLRLGGDGRAARYRRIEGPAQSGLQSGARFRIVLATPAIFSGGWIPDGCTHAADGSIRLYGPGFTARLACASVARHGVVSGWDIAARRPKVAQRVVPAGSVYWFDEFEGDARKLATWVAGGIWADTDAVDVVRRAEGFNLAWLGEWH